jgi:anti-sigma regulatory factor (Ser/Thr protein kinase)
MADLPVTAVCLYDRKRMPADVVTSAALTHPHLLTPGGWIGNDAFEPASSFVRRLPVPREPMEDGPAVYAVDDAPTLPDLRHALGAALDAHVPDADLRDDLHLALSEVAANAFRHGRRPVSARLWTDGVRMVCTISDGGTSFDDPLAGFVPAHGYDLSRGGMGLWLARKLWDHVDLIAHADGFTVRLSTALGDSGTP